MAAGLSDTLKQDLLGHLFLGKKMSVPKGTWVQLHSGPPGSRGTGHPIAAPRSPVVLMPTSTFGTFASMDAVMWHELPGVIIVAATLWDAERGGNCLWYGDFPSPITVREGEALSVLSGGLRVELLDEETI